MEKTNTHRRNLCGGFLGGTLGIFGFAYISTEFLLIGCLFGAIIGWLHLEILAIIVEAFQAMCIRFRETTESMTLFFWKVLGILATSRRFIVKTWESCISIPNRIHRYLQWRKKHPLHRIHDMQMIAVLLYVGINFVLWMFPLLKWLFPNFLSLMDSHGKSIFVGGLTLFGKASLLALGIVFMLEPKITADGKSSKCAKSRICTERSLWKKYKREGLILFVTKHFGHLLRQQCATILLMTTFLTYILSVVLLFAVFLALPITILYSVLQLIIRVSRKVGYWPCVGITLVVTSYVAHIVSPYIHDPRIVCVAALSAGMICALATVSISTLCTRFIAKSKRIQWLLTTPLSQQVMVFDPFFNRVANFGIDKFRTFAKVIAF